MHLTDKRVFQLGDSVYKALELTDGFAAELDMNRLGTQLTNQFIAESEEKASVEPVKVKEAVSAETWAKYKQQLEKKFNKKADKITVDDLENLESKLQVELFKKGDMPTFLDAWLSGQARKQGKWVGGIEDFEDQLEHKDDIEEKIQLALFDDDYYRGGLDWFIKIYTDQKLDSIDTYMYREENGKKDYIMIKRNLKMARRMDSLSAIRSTLFAVGAAHLPGDSGVIALLSSRGFTVTPVISTKKISPDKYISKAVESPWIPVSVKDSIYALQMPGVAEGVEMFESMGLEMKMFFDLSFMKMYMTLGVELPEERKKSGADSLFNSMKNRYAANGKVLKEKPVTVNGTTGREYRISTDDGEMKMQVFIPGMERVVLNAVFTFNEKSLNESETEKFFQSFVYNKNSRKPVTTEKIWSQLNFPLQSFTVEMPVTPRETKDVVSEEGKITYTWQAIDIKDQIFYGMSVSAMKEGMYDSGDDTAYFLAIKDRVKERLEEGKVLASSFFSVSSYPGFSVSMSGKAKEEVIETNILAVSRGGLSYYLYIVYSPVSANRQIAERFLKSFRLLPYDHPAWKPVSSPDESFTTTFPFSLKRKEQEEDDIHPGSERFIGYDSVAAVSIYVDKTPLPGWYWYNTDTGFLRIRSKQYSSWSDSVADYKLVNTGNMKVVSFTVIKPGDHLVKKVKLVLNGNELYEIFGNFAQQDLPGMYNKFFDNFKVMHEIKGSDRSQSRVNELLAALKNADKKTAKEIKDWWDDIEFTKTDVPALQKMLLKVYPDFDTTYYGNLNKKVFDEIEFLDSSNTTVEFIKNNYSSIQPENEYIKPLVISYLSNVQTAESFSVLKDCLTKYSVNISGTPYFSHSLYDSLQLTATLYPEVMKLGSTESMWGLICGTATSLLDSNLLAKNTVKEYGSYFSTTAKKVLDKEKDDIEEGGYTYIDLIRILGIINTTESNGLLTRFSKFNNRQIKFRTLITMLENNLAVDNRNFLTFGMIDEYRHELYDELKRINKLKLFPVSYLSQKELARSKLYEYATDEEPPTGIINAGEKTILYKGKQQKFYFYKISFSDGLDAAYYLAVAGPYSTNPKDVNSTHEATGVYWYKKFDTRELDSLFQEYLKSLEEDEDGRVMPPPAGIIMN
jgi:uncharacterized protein YbaP (TraB family)